MDQESIGGAEGRKFRFEETNLGSSPPKITGIRASSRVNPDTGEKEAVVIDFKVSTKLYKKKS